MLQQSSRGIGARPRTVALWLFVVAALIVLTTTIGGITRLTESGLSITQWKPISGIVPPLTHAQWEAEFARYRQIPQYAAIHADITLDGFQWIFFWEYLHRLIDRLIGLVFAVALAWSALKRWIPKGYGWPLVGLLLLIGAQGALGWIMVRSGLSDRIEVAPLLLAAHLLTALLALTLIVWTALNLLALDRNPYAKPARVTGFGAGVAAVLAVQLFYGALMAGLRAGLVTNEWPLMNGRVFPTEVLGTRPLPQLMISDPALVHFIHRWWAWVLVAMLLVLARRARAAGDRAASIAIHAAFGTQILLGIATVMSQVNIVLAALHQLVGALLAVAVAWGVHAIGLRRVPGIAWPTGRGRA